VLYWIRLTDVILGFYKGEIEYWFKKWFEEDCAIRDKKGEAKNSETWRINRPYILKLQVAAQQHLSKDRHDNEITVIIARMSTIDFVSYSGLFFVAIFLIISLYRHNSYLEYAGLGAILADSGLILREFRRQRHRQPEL
jgi:hypothetical protein